VGLDVAVLCSRQELGEAAAEALEALAGGGDIGSRESSSRDGSSSEAGSSDAGSVGEAEDSSSECTLDDAERSSSGGHARLVWLRPVASAAESWQQLEPALEQLEGVRGSCLSRHGAVRPSLRSALPRHISRAPRQFADPLRTPRTSLLAPRSGVQQPALCR
jgi:hypothetical protein